MNRDARVQKNALTAREHTTSKSCPRFIQERNMLEFKCRNRCRTTEEARRLFNQSSNYSNVVKTNVTMPDVEESINPKEDVYC
ncbi:hypothetical protein AVEN_144934-1 [Araneus ventricosus]|uniref:Uncharacterized protein n=1 Tax=Araneus ventricosus TaxID=182803 RepID=A0A4Y2FZ63_ARAVE|nr:hypothetical protein AVEN_144934-1 [Araneus ventricosus]